MIILAFCLVGADIPNEVLAGWNNGLLALAGREFELDIKDSRSAKPTRQNRIVAFPPRNSPNAFNRIDYLETNAATITFQNDHGLFSLARKDNGHPWTLSHASKVNDSGSVYPLKIDSVSDTLLGVFGGFGDTGIVDLVKSGRASVTSVTQTNSGGYTIDFTLRTAETVPVHLIATLDSEPYFPVKRYDKLAGDKLASRHTFVSDGFCDDRHGVPCLKEIFLEEYAPTGNDSRRTLEIKVLHQGPSRRSVQDFDLNQYGIPSSPFQDSAKAVGFRYYALGVLAVAFAVWAFANVRRRLKRRAESR
jgi:hypothetical protein